MALSLGTITGRTTAGYIYEQLKEYEVAKYYMRPAIVGTSFGEYFVDQDAWDSLPDDLQALLAGAARGSYYEHGRAEDEAERVMLVQVIESFGTEIVPMSEELQSQLAEAGAALLDEYSSKTPNCAKLAGIIKDYMKVKGYLK